jgi:hypothetical protein
MVCMRRLMSEVQRRFEARGSMLEQGFGGGSQDETREAKGFFRERKNDDHTPVSHLTRALRKPSFDRHF